MSKTIFMTGATGYVGCHMVHRFLLQGHTVVALVRGKKGVSPRERLETAVLEVGPLGESALSKLNVINGTVHEEADQLVAKYEALNLGRLDEVWHSAAIFNFKERERPQVRATNIEGTRHLLEFTRQIQGDATPRFVYISTAYSTGRDFNSGVPEEIPRHVADFRSIYEWSKHQAEQLVASYWKEHGLEVMIFRPSIIVGTPDSTVPCFSGYYQVVTECQRLQRVMKSRLGKQFTGNVNTRLRGHVELPLNIVPIDFVVDSMVYLAENGQEANGRLPLYNIVNEEPPTIEMVHEAVTRSLALEGLDIVPPTDFEERPMSQFEKVINRRIAFQAPYMHEDIRFETAVFRQQVPKALVPAPAINVDYLMAVNEQFLGNLGS